MPLDEPTELRHRLAGYATAGALPRAAPTQALAPHVVATNGRYYLLVSWYAPHATSRVMMGRTAADGAASPLGPYYDREGVRMDRTVASKIAPSPYSHVKGVRYEGSNLPLSEWAPPGSEPYNRIKMSVRCGPNEELGDASPPPEPYRESIADAEGHRYVKPDMFEPYCATAESGVLIETREGMKGVKSEFECQQYCAAAPRCAAFAYVAEGSYDRAWPRDYGGGCWLKAANGTDASSATPAAADGFSSPNDDFSEPHDFDAFAADDAFVWGQKPPALPVDIPGGSLLLDAPSLSQRGWARGPSSAGLLSFLSNMDLEHGTPIGGVTPRHVLTYSYSAAPPEDVLVKTTIEDFMNDGLRFVRAGPDRWDVSNASAYGGERPQLGARELVVDADGWLALRGKGAAATPGYSLELDRLHKKPWLRQHKPLAWWLAHGFDCGRRSVVTDDAKRSPACARAAVADPVFWNPNGDETDAGADLGLIDDGRGGEAASVNGDWGLQWWKKGEPPPPFTVGELPRPKPPADATARDEPYSILDGRPAVSTGDDDDLPSSTGGADEAHRAIFSARRFRAARSWPLHLRPIPPPCADAPPEEARYRGMELGFVPPPSSCREARAVGLCHDERMRSRCRQSCGACVPAPAVSCGCEPPPDGLQISAYGAMIGDRDAPDYDDLVREATRRTSPLMTCEAIEPVVSHTSPRSTASLGGGAVTVHGSGFSHPATCTFAESEAAVPASRVTAHSLVCVAPRPEESAMYGRESRTTHNDGLGGDPYSFDVFPSLTAWEARGAIWDRQVRITSHGAECDGRLSMNGPWSRLRSYNASVLLALSSVQPAGGPVAGGSMLTLFGDRIFAPPAPFPHTRVTRNRMRCVLYELEGLDADGPWRGGGRRGVDWDGGGWAGEGGWLGDDASRSSAMAAALARVGNATPPSGNSTPATVIGPYSARCRSPARSLPGTVAIGLRLNDELTDAPTVDFTYYEVAPLAAADDEASPAVSADPPESSSAPAPLELLSINPFGGPSGGGTTITLTGKGITDLGGHDHTGHAVHGPHCLFSFHSLPADAKPATRYEDDFGRDFWLNEGPDPEWDGPDDPEAEDAPTGRWVPQPKPRAKKVDRAEHLPTVVAAAARAAASADAKVHTLEGNIERMRARLADTIDPPPSEAERSELLSLVRELELRRKMAADATYELERLHAYGYDFFLGDPLMAKLPGAVPAFPVKANRTSGAYGGARANGTMAITCEAPPLPVDTHGPTEVRVYLTINADASTFTAGSMPFTYYPHMGLRLRASEPFGGDVDGNTTVTIHLGPQTLPALATPTATYPGPVCSFGPDTDPVPATVAAAGSVTRTDAGGAAEVGTTVRCVSPPVSTTPSLWSDTMHGRRWRPDFLLRDVVSELPLSVALNGQDFVGFAPLPWHYVPYHKLVISALVPSSGPVAGGTEVTVVGTGLNRELGGLACRFGPASAAPVPASRVDFHSIKCATPPAYLVDGGGEGGGPDWLAGEGRTRALVFEAADGPFPTAEVCVILNGVGTECAGGGQYSQYRGGGPGGSGASPPTFTYYNTSAVSRIYPSAGPTAGGTRIYLWGGGFLNASRIRAIGRAIDSGESDAQPVCRFGDGSGVLVAADAASAEGDEGYEDELIVTQPDIDTADAVCISPPAWKALGEPAPAEPDAEGGEPHSAGGLVRVRLSMNGAAEGLGVSDVDFRYYEA